MKWYPLTEYKPGYFTTLAAGEKVWRSYTDQISVEFPSPKTDGKWKLTPQGWVGFLPLSKEEGIQLRPKVPLANLFQMLEYAYQLKSFHFLDGSVQSETVQKLFERLAVHLATQVSTRTRKGLYRQYMDQIDEGPFLRGKMDVQHRIRNAWNVNIRSEYQEHEADIEDNRILLWTLYKIMQSGICREPSLLVLRHAYRGLKDAASLTPMSASACTGRIYNRLNQDYKPMHALCRFFLENIGAHHTRGDRTMSPFIVNMAQLFESFVAEWLKLHLPKNYELKTQENVKLGQDGAVRFAIDLVIYDRELDRVKCVVDTKYKNTGTPESADVSQVVTYAVMKDCKEAVLLYPTEDVDPLDEYVGDIRVRRLGFDLSWNLEESGERFLNTLLAGG
ncbi:5-methylcytosine-specific restriction enzyme subunit McrC [Geomicrobium halophilum]|uniref:5-methylcytosine-specific restriction enzyme subunit McrC n=1 Tax=Geomicrobium halophilum TaxID=549000 RepID=A0A841PQB6_9BACL|nr:restriction endonuclease [Geomicrobium halophilum]MBB6451047.1 5-methylcytosine-specific restriction enzyme subunit McrC [Geomicrobium halophilum]